MSGKIPPKAPEESKTYRELYHYLRENLATPMEARELFSLVTGMAVSALPFAGEQSLPDEEQWLRTKQLIARRQQGEPLQYLLGEWEFYGITLAVGEGVLIPRSDTEVLVDWALALLPEDSTAQVVDLCAGSGAIGLAIASHRPQAVVTAVELSADAFSYLERNNKVHGNRLVAVQADVLQYAHPQPVDLIVSNPPYIPAAQLDSLQKEVGYEPALALDGGYDGLDFYRFITQRYHRQLTAGGWLLFEVGIDQSEAVCEILNSQGFEQIETRRDLGGIPRAVCGKKATSEIGKGEGRRGKPVL